MKKQKVHTEAFQREAVRRSLSEDIATLSRELGITKSQLYNWRSKIKRSEGTLAFESESKPSTPEKNSVQAELRRLRQKVAEQKDEIKFLEKALMHFAKQKR